jgi:hypothetical protein
MEEIPSWLSHIKIPEEYFVLVVEEISRCARHMVNGTYKILRFLCIQDDFSLTISLEVDSCDEGDYEDEQNLCLEEEIEVEEVDNVLVPPISTRAVESESYEDDYEDYFGGYQGNNDLEEDEEKMEVEEEIEVKEEDNRFLTPITSAIESES